MREVGGGFKLIQCGKKTRKNGFGIIVKSDEMKRMYWM